jgi:hypothetical protein
MQMQSSVDVKIKLLGVHFSLEKPKRIIIAVSTEKKSIMNILNKCQQNNLMI